jgi:hypothetical protein
MHPSATSVATSCLLMLVPGQELGSQSRNIEFGFREEKKG